MNHQHHFCRLGFARNQHDVAKARVKARVVLPLVLSTTLCACAMVPGQHMATPATLPVTTADNGDVTSNIQIPIVPIDLTLIRQMQAAHANEGNANELVGKPGPYRIGAADVLQITVWDHPELAAALGQLSQTTKASDPASGFVVDSDGDIQFPFVTKPVHVAGNSVEQVQHEIRTELRKVFIDPQVTVRVASYRASQIYIDGEVRTPGAQTINDIPMTLTEAINRAGGLGPNADQSHVTIMRNGTSYPLNIVQIIALGRNPADYMLQAGDLLHVSARADSTAYVMGEVNKPTAVIPTQDGKLTLSEALNQAGFVNASSADAKQLYVIRQTSGKKPEIYHLDASSPVSMLLANQFDLQSKDVVYVDNNSLVRFNRVISLLLPVVNAGLTAAIVTK